MKKDNSLRILQNQLLMEEQYGDIKKDSDVINEEIRISNMKFQAVEKFCFKNQLRLTIIYKLISSNLPKFS